MAVVAIRPLPTQDFALKLLSWDGNFCMPSGLPFGIQGPKRRCASERRHHLSCRMFSLNCAPPSTLDDPTPLKHPVAERCGSALTGSPRVPAFDTGARLPQDKLVPP